MSYLPPIPSYYTLNFSLPFLDILYLSLTATHTFPDLLYVQVPATYPRCTTSIIPFLMPFLRSTIVLPSLLPTTYLLHLHVYYSPPYAFSHNYTLIGPATYHISTIFFPNERNSLFSAFFHISTVFFSLCFMSHIYCILLFLFSVTYLLYSSSSAFCFRSTCSLHCSPWSPAHTAETSPQGVVIFLQPSRHHEPLPQC